MSVRSSRKKQVWFGVFLAGGLTLALILLAQTVSTYLYVSGNMVTQAGLRDAEDRLRSAERMIRRVDGTDRAQVASVLDQVQAESGERVMWLRLVRPDGTVVAWSGEPEGEPVSFSSLRRSMDDRGAFYETREAIEGKALVTVSPIRLNESDGPFSGGFALLEIAVDLDGLAAGFVYLRANLVIGVSASLALLGTLLLIWIRFPNYLRGKQLESQVEIARTVQSDLLPISNQVSADADVSAVCQQAGHVGGDFYDLFETERRRLAMILGDVAGKGIAAAPLMGFIHGATHASAWTESSYDHEGASRRLNDLLCRKTAAERFVSMFWAYFDTDDSTLRYVNAGHLPALLLRRGSTGVETRRLGEGGPVLGVLPGAAYTQGDVDIEPGDVLVVFSDGIAEASNALDEEFGELRIARAVQDAWEDSAEDIRNRILFEVREFSANDDAADDRTLIVIRFAHASRAKAGEEAVAVYA
jgi:hypothetical protein